MANENFKTLLLLSKVLLLKVTNLKNEILNFFTNQTEKTLEFHHQICYQYQKTNIEFFRRPTKLLFF